MRLDGRYTDQADQADDPPSHSRIFPPPFVSGGCSTVQSNPVVPPTCRHLGDQHASRSSIKMTLFFHVPSTPGSLHCMLSTCLAVNLSLETHTRTSPTDTEPRSETERQRRGQRDTSASVRCAPFEVYPVTAVGRRGALAKSGNRRVALTTKCLNEALRAHTALK